MNILVRSAVQEDMPYVLELIKELALYEKAAGEVSNTSKSMIADGFGNNPVFYCDVAEVDDRIVGAAIYFIKYSTWKGKGIYLDDIIVTETMRGKGIGKKLFETVIDNAKRMDAKQLHWQVLNWNETAIGFYRKYNPAFDDQWINCKLSLNNT